MMSHNVIHEGYLTHLAVVQLSLPYMEVVNSDLQGWPEACGQVQPGASQVYREVKT